MTATRRRLYQEGKAHRELDTHCLFCGQDITKRYSIDGSKYRIWESYNNGKTSWHVHCLHEAKLGALVGVKEFQQAYRALREMDGTDAPRL